MLKIRHYWKWLHLLCLTTNEWRPFRCCVLSIVQGLFVRIPFFLFWLLFVWYSSRTDSSLLYLVYYWVQYITIKYIDSKKCYTINTKIPSFNYKIEMTDTVFFLKNVKYFGEYPLCLITYFKRFHVLRIIFCE